MICMIFVKRNVQQMETLLLLGVSNVMKGVVCFCSIAYLYDRAGHLE